MFLRVYCPAGRDRWFSKPIELLWDMRALPGLRAPRGTNHRPGGDLCLPDVRNHRTAGNACVSKPGLAGNRCGHRRITRILEETVVDTVVKPQVFPETVPSSIQVRKK